MTNTYTHVIILKNTSTAAKIIKPTNIRPNYMLQIHRHLHPSNCATPTRCAITPNPCVHQLFNAGEHAPPADNCTPSARFHESRVTMLRTDHVSDGRTSELRLTSVADVLTSLADHVRACPAPGRPITATAAYTRGFTRDR